MQTTILVDTKKLLLLSRGRNLKTYNFIGTKNIFYWIRILSIENSLKFSHVESQPSIMREKVRINL